ncbi:MAG: hypothetical protein NZM65_07620 [Flavobacteriales bacterium]|nr:hypothetical protein [Flavobacteriales bacterium]MDW8410541.1 hypothetical protein [Flavobacteriales bacterium]
MRDILVASLDLFVCLLFENFHGLMASVAALGARIPAGKPIVLRINGMEQVNLLNDFLNFYTNCHDVPFLSPLRFEEILST